MQRIHRFDYFRHVLLFVTLVATVGCSDRSPTKIGFIGGLSGHNADTGINGRNGASLAIELFNRAGGINGRAVILLEKDDAQSSEIAARSAEELAQEGVEAVIGPFTSSMAATIVPILEKKSIVVVSPTITSMAFFGRNDHLFRINRTTRDNTRDYATHMVRRGDRRISIAYDTRNKSFAASWIKEFEAVAAELGLTVVNAVPYESRQDTAFDQVVASMVAAKPDSLFFISGALDVPRLVQQARKLAPRMKLAASEWAGTEELLRFGGEIVEGLLIILNYDPTDQSPRYREFADAYFQKFRKAPGYSAAMAYDATTVVLSAMKQRSRGQSMKDAIAQSGPYEGVQQQIVFDANGDTQRKVYVTEVRHGRFVPIPLEAGK